MREFKAPEGWALVPVKPTQSMVNAAKEIDGRLSVWKWADGYTAMLNQAPKPPEDHIPDAGNMVDEAAMARLHENGRKAWAELDGKSASDWVDEIRGNERHDCEPIYQFRKAGSGCPEWHDGHPDQTDGGGPYETRTLYAAPPKREPLSDEQLWSNDEIMSLNADLGWHMDTIRMFARAIERAHGIGGQS